MSRMSELSIDIQAMLEEGHEPRAAFGFKVSDVFTGAYYTV